MKAALALALLAAAGAAAPAPAAPSVVVYRCVAADGSVTLQNDRRCAKGLREERRVVELPTSRAAPATPGATPPAPIAPMPAEDGDAMPGATPTDSPPTIELGRAAAPPLFACRAWDGAGYYGDSEAPPPRCAPLQAVGLDGRAMDAAQACELRADTCEPVAEAARCEAWAERLRRAEAALEFPTGDSAAAREELDRVRTTIAGTVCAR